MRNTIKCLLALSLSVFIFTSQAQQTYISQKINNSALAKKAEETSLLEIQPEQGFVGCIDYEITYSGVQTEDPEAIKKISFLVEDITENYGTKRTRCYNASGDWVVLYHGAKHVKNVWYFAETNEEYTLFTNSVLKYEINDKPEPDGMYDLGLTKLKKVKGLKSILGYNLTKYEVERESGMRVEYWVTEKILRNKISYTNNKMAFTNEIFEVVQGIQLYEKKVVGNLFVTTEEAIKIDKNPPDDKLFILPNVYVYEW